MSRICIIDRKEYQYCPKCNSSTSHETWRYLFCSENCRKVYSIINDYKAGRLEAIDARNKLETECKIAEMKELHSVIKGDIDEIFEKTSELKVEEVAFEVSKVKMKNKKNSE